MTMFDADRAKRISEDVLKALKAVGDRHGVTFHLGRMTGGVTLRMQLVCATVGEGGRAFNRERLDFKQFCDGYGLKPEDLGRTIVVRGLPYEIIGLNIAAPKFPVLAMRKEDGRVFKFPAKAVVDALGDRQ